MHFVELDQRPAMYLRMVTYYSAVMALVENTFFLNISL